MNNVGRERRGGRDREREKVDGVGGSLEQDNMSLVMRTKTPRPREEGSEEGIGRLRSRELQESIKEKWKELKSRGKERS